MLFLDIRKTAYPWFCVWGKQHIHDFVYEESNPFIYEVLRHNVFLRYSSSSTLFKMLGYFEKKKFLFLKKKKKGKGKKQKSICLLDDRSVIKSFDILPCMLKNLCIKEQQIWFISISWMPVCQVARHLSFVHVHFLYHLETTISRNAKTAVHRLVFLLASLSK